MLLPCRFLKIMATVWAGSQVTKLARAAGWAFIFLLIIKCFSDTCGSAYQVSNNPTIWTVRSNLFTGGNDIQHILTSTGSVW